MELNTIILVNFKNKQVKLNLCLLDSNKQYLFTVGLILKILNLYKKSNRKNILFLKYLINYLIKKYLILHNKKTMFIIKGLVKNYIKVLYYFKQITLNFNINFFLINPIKIFNNLKIKKKRSIKRRLFKKLVDFNNI